jgi:hypothetical protein
LSHVAAQLPLLVSFCSPKPISFSTVVALAADTGDCCSFFVSVTTDNSIFTLHSCLSLNPYRLVNRPSKSIQAVGDKFQPVGDFLSSFLSIADYGKPGDLGKTTSLFVKECAVRFLNTLVLTSQISIFPDDFAQANGDLLLEVINSLAGPVHGLKKHKSPIETLTSILHHLMGIGASVGEVKPEFLLPKEPFMNLCRDRIVAQLLGIGYYGAPDLSSFDTTELSAFMSSHTFMDALTPRLNAVGNLYAEVSYESHILVILQIIRFFYFGKLSIEHFGATPGVPESLKVLKPLVSQTVYAELSRPVRTLASSNVFTNTESALLLWASIHYSAQNPQNPKLFASFSELKDPVIFMYIIRNHIADFPLEIVEERSTNCEVLTNSMRDLNLQFFPSAVELQDGDNIILAIFLFQLYQTLPHYVATTTLEFATPLNKPINQSVTLSNPSKCQVVYNAKLYGSSSFRCISSSVVLAPNQTLDFQVRFLSNNHLPQAALLRLLPETTFSMSQALSAAAALPPMLQTIDFTTGSSPIFASPICVQLQSVVTSEVPLKSFNVEGPIYEPTSSRITIDNPMDTGGRFQVYVKCYMIADEKGTQLDGREALKKQMKDILDNPTTLPDPRGKTAFDRLVEAHEPFVFE